ncbi:MAG: hypothetical protein RSE32_13675 [Comamonas sp.]|uniref:hypothetical protein n=1 Tax=Comamonas sp. TaxID=34028 RepID=UPI002FCBCF04
MKFLKAAAAGAFLIIAAAGAQAQSVEPVKQTKYVAFIESDYGLDLSLKPDGKVTHYYWGFDDNGKKGGTTTHGTWTQAGDKVTVQLKRGNVAKTLVFQIKEQNNPTSISMDCKGPYGLTRVSEKGSEKIWSEEQMWPANLIKDKGPCK